MRARFSYQGHDAAQGRRRLVLATVLVLSCVLADFVSHGAVRGLFQDAGSSVGAASIAVGDGIFGSGAFETKRQLETENEQLRNQLDGLKQQSALITYLQSQNAELSKLAKLAASTRGVSAAIVSGLSASPSGTFLIDAGSSAGIKPRDLVLTNEGIAIGTVAMANARSSLVTVLLSSRQSTEAMVDGVQVSVVGQAIGSGSALAPRGAPIEPGDAVEAPGLAGSVIGIVAGVASTSASASARLSIGLPVSLYSLRHVFVQSL